MRMKYDIVLTLIYDVKIIILIVMMKVTIASCLKCVDIFQSVAAMHCSTVYFCIAQCISVNCAVYFCELRSVLLWIAQCISVKYTVYLCAVLCSVFLLQCSSWQWHGDSIGVTGRQRSYTALQCSISGENTVVQRIVQVVKSQDIARVHHSNTFGIHYSPLHWEQGAV